MSNNGKKALRVVGYTMLMVAAQVMATVAETKLAESMQPTRRTKTNQPNDKGQTCLTKRLQ